MSKYQDFLNFYEKLNHVSPSLCLAKWLQLTLHLGTGKNHSCHHPKTHPVSKEQIKYKPSALHNTDQKKIARQMMLSGERPPECEYCWNIEDRSGTNYSDRALKSYEPWARDKLAEISQAPAEKDFNPTYLELSFNNICNLKCSYCSPEFSTQWLAEIKQHGPYVFSQDHSLHELSNEEKQLLNGNEDNEYIRTFWQWWPTLKKDLQFFRITGGEPLMSTNTFNVFGLLLEDPQPHLTLAINTNLDVPKARFDKFLFYISEIKKRNAAKHIQVYTSLDTWGKDAEYIRYGLRFENFIGNLCELLEKHPTVEISLMCTFNILSVPNFQEFLTQYLSLKKTYIKEDWGLFNLDISYLRYPEHLSILLLPKAYLQSKLGSMEEFINDHIHSEKGPGFFEKEALKFQNIRKYALEQNYENLDYLRSCFYLYFTEYDRRRQTHFLETFPELGDFWQLCKSCSVLHNPHGTILNENASP